MHVCFLGFVDIAESIVSRLPLHPQEPFPEAFSPLKTTAMHRRDVYRN
jgi:hypothetical protein